MSTPSPKNKAAVALGRRGGSKSSTAKSVAAKQNASQPPRPGKRIRGRPYSDAKLAAVFGKDSTFAMSELDKGKLVIPYSKERFEIALKALQSQAKAAEGMLHQLVSRKKQNRTASKAAHIAMRECKPEVDMIMAFVGSKATKKTVPELTPEDLVPLLDAEFLLACAEAMPPATIPASLLIPVSEAPHIPQPQPYGGLVLDKCDPMPSPAAPKTFDQVCREETTAIANTLRKRGKR